MSNLNTREIDEKTPLMVLAGPMFGEMLLNILVNTVDTMMISHATPTGAGAVGNANQLMFFLILLFNIIATSTSVVVAQYLGAKKFDRMNTIYSLAVTVNLIAGIVFCGIFVLCKDLILTVINVPEEMRYEASVYINIVGGTLFLQAVYNVLLQILRCNGYAKIGLYISIAMNIINVIGNYTFLFGALKFLELGVGGAAISTAVARGVALISAFVYFYVKKVGKISVKYIMPFPWKMLGKMIKIGLPSAGESLSYNLYQLVLLSFINNMGANATNAKVYSAQLVSLSMVFSNQAALATQIITGHLVGAGKEDAAYRRVFTTLKISMPITIGLSVLNWLLSPYSLRAFTSVEEEIQLASLIMLIDIFIEIGRCLNMTFISSLKASGDLIFPFVLGLIMMWGVGVTVGYTMGVIVGIGCAGVFIGTATDELMRGVVSMMRWKQKKWVGKAIVSKDRNKIEIE